MTKKILVADDDLASRLLMAKAIEREGYSVILASDGIRARTILDDNADIALMITDIVMPGLDGRDLLRGLRRDGGFTQLPTIVVSGNVAEDTVLADHVRGETDAQLVDFLPKPVNIEELLRIVKTRTAPPN
ncbi:MAG: hypothetical protein RJA70_4326 [Pseudomonadota bacterium]|jgi:CheY-like chemotaxis protein